MGQKPTIYYDGDDACWLGRKYKGTIYGEGTAQPVDAWDNNERGERKLDVKLTRRGVKVSESGTRKLRIPVAGQLGMRSNAQGGRPDWPPEPPVPGPQSWAEEDE